MKKTSYLILLFCLLFSCSQPDKTVDLEVSEEASPLIGLFHPASIQTYSFNNTEYVACHSIDSVSYIRLYRQTDSIYSEFIIPTIDSFGTFRSYYFHSKDTLSILYKKGLITLAAEDSVYKYHKITNPYKGVKSHTYLIGLFDSDYMPFKVQGNAVIFPQYSMEISYWDTAFYSKPLFVRYNLKTKSAQSLDATYPVMYRSNSYGNANQITYVQHNRQLYYCGTAADTLYMYNFKNNSTETSSNPNPIYDFFCDTFPTKNSGDMSKVFEHYTSNDLVMKLMLDIKNEVLYQVIWKAIPLVNSDNSFNSINDKGICINVYDFDGKLLASADVSQKVIWDHSFVINGKVFLKLKNHEKYISYNFFSSSSN